jgi:hypothetical protein
MCIFTHSTLTRALPVAFVLLVTGAPAIAASTVTFPVSVPQECMELAQREGVPTVISSKYEAAKARIKLARMSGRDPLVQQCREAVQRARRAALQTDQR